MRRIPSLFLASTMLAITPAVGFSAENAPKPAPAKDAAKAPPNPLTRKPPNPLAIDPFVGEFEGEETTVALKAVGDGYEGTIRRLGQSFSLKAKRKDQKLIGAFIFDGFSYDISIALDGTSIRLATEEKTFVLKRKEPAKQPEPAIQEKPLPAPVAPTPSKPDLSEVPTDVTAPTPAKINYAAVTPEKLRLLNWSRFPAGATADYEVVGGTTSVILDPVKKRITWAGESAGKGVLKIQRWMVDEWSRSEEQPPPTESAIRIDDLGYTKGESNEEISTVETAPIRCNRTTYTTKSQGQAGPMTVTVVVWRSHDIDIPMLTIDLPAKRLLIEPDMVKAQVTIDYENGGKAEMSQELLSLRKHMRIDNVTVTCAIVKTTHTLTKGTSRIERLAEHWLTHQVPGGVARSLESEVRGNGTVRTITTMTSFATPRIDASKP